MTSPSPFDIGRAVSGGLTKGLRRSEDRSALDDILTRANETGDPEVVNQTLIEVMNRVSPENRAGAFEFLKNKQQQIQTAKQQELRSRILGGSQDETQIDPVDTQSLSKEEQLSRLDNQERQLINSGLDSKVISEDLKAIRSKRNVIAQELSGGEKEAGKEAAKRRSTTITTLSDKAEAAESTITAVEGLEAFVKEGGTGPSARNSLLNATEGKGGVLGVVNDFMQSAEKQGFTSAQRAFFPQLKAFFGSRITDVDLKTFMSTLAQFGTDPKAQEFALFTLRQQAEADLNMGNAVLDFIDDDGKPVKGFERKLKNRRVESEKEARENFKNKAEELGIIRGANPPIQTEVGVFSQSDLIEEANRRGLLGAL